MPDGATAEVLREREAPAISGTPPVVPTELETLGREIFGRYRAAGEERAAAARRRAEAMKPTIQAAREAAERVEQVPPPAAPPTLAAPPSRGLSPFLASREGETPEASLGKLIAAMGLFATGASGLAKGSARAGLAGLIGAMKGWREGDRERADLAFADWSAETGKALKQWDVERTTYQDIMARANLTLDQKIGLIKLDMMEHGLEDEALKIEEGGLEAVLGFLTGRSDAAQKLAIEFTKLEAAKIRADENERWRRLQYEQSERHFREAKDPRLGEHATKWENAAGEQPDPTLRLSEASKAGFRPVGKISTAGAFRATMTLMDQLDALIPALEKKGFMAASSAAAAVLRARAKRSEWTLGYGKPGDPDLQAWLAHGGTMVSIQRQLGDIGPRAMAAFQSAVNIVEHPTTAGAARQALGNLRDALQAAQPRREPGKRQVVVRDRETNQRFLYVFDEGETELPENLLEEAE